MSTVIDSRVVEMQFDNQNFEKNVSQSINSLNQMDQAISKSTSGEGFSQLGAAATAVGQKFSVLETIATGALLRIGSQAEATAERLIKSLTIDQVTAGWNKYAEKTSGVQTIMAATGKSIDEVNDQLSKLMWFTDETSYNFVDMVGNIGKFTSNGIALDDAVNSMQGIANWAAISGANSRNASAAMYNFSQALGAGAMKLQDWKSIENANMATSQFKQTVIDTAIALGTVKKNADGTYTAFNSATKAWSKNTFTLQTFNSELSTGWFSKDVMVDVLGQYSKFSDKLGEICDQYGVTASEFLSSMDAYKKGETTLEKAASDLGISEKQLASYFKEFEKEEYQLGLNSFKAAQEAKTFGEAIESVKDAVSSGWMQTFEYLFGNYEKAKRLWTDLANWAWDIFAQPSENRNEWLEEALFHHGGKRQMYELNEEGIMQFTGWDSVEKNMARIKGMTYKDFKDVYGKISSGMKNGTITASEYKQALYDTTDQMQELMEWVTRSENAEFGAMMKDSDKWNKNVKEAGFDDPEKLRQYILSLRKAYLEEGNARPENENWKGTSHWEDDAIALEDYATKLHSVTDAEFEQMIANRDMQTGTELFTGALYNLMDAIHSDDGLGFLDVWRNAASEVFTDPAGSIYTFLYNLNAVTGALKLNENEASSLQTIFQNVLSIANAVGSGIANVLRNAIDIFVKFRQSPITEMILSGIASVTSSFVGLGDSITSMFNGAINLATTLATTLISALSSDAFTGSFSGIQVVLGFFGNVISTTITGIGKAFEFVGSVLNEVSKVIGEVHLGDTVKNLLSPISAIIESIASAMSGLFSSVENLKVSEYVAKVFEPLHKLLNGEDFEPTWLTTTFSVISNWLTTISEKARAFSDWIKETKIVETVFTALGSSVKNIGSRFVGFIKKISSSEKVMTTFSKVSESIRFIFSALSSLTTTVFSGIIDGFSKLNASMDGDLLTAFGNAVSWVGEKILNLIDYISDGILKFRDWISENENAQKILTLLKDSVSNFISGFSNENSGLRQMLTNISTFAGSAFDTIKTFVSEHGGSYITDAINSLTSVSLEDINFGELASNLGNKLLEIIKSAFEYVKNGTSEIPSFSEIIDKWFTGKSSERSITSIFSDLLGDKNTVKNAEDTIDTTDKMGKHFEHAGKQYNAAAAEMEVSSYTISDSAENTETKTTTALGKVKEIFQNTATKVSEFYEKVKQYVGDHKGLLSFAAVAAGLAVVIRLVFSPLYALSNGITKLANPIGKGLTTIGDAFKGIGKSVKSYLKSKTVRQWATSAFTLVASIGVLVVAIYALSKIASSNSDALWDAMGTIVIIVGVLTAMAFATSLLTKISGSTAGAVASIVGFSLTILSMAAALWVISKMPIQDIGKSLLIIVALEAILTVFYGLLIFLGNFGELKGLSGFAKTMGTMIALSVGLVSFALALYVVSKIPIDKLQENLKSLAIVIGSMIVLLVAARVGGKYAASATASILLMELAMMSFYLVLNVMTLISPELVKNASRSILLCGAMLLGLALIIRSAGSSAADVGKSFIGLSISLIAIVGVIYLLQDISPKNCLKATLVISGLILALSVLASSIPCASEGSVVGGKSFIISLIALVASLGSLLYMMTIVMHYDPKKSLIAIAELMILAIGIYELLKSASIDAAAFKNLLALSAVFLVLGGVLTAMTLLTDASDLEATSKAFKSVLTLFSMVFLLMNIILSDKLLGQTNPVQVNTERFKSVLDEMLKMMLYIGGVLAVLGAVSGRFGVDASSYIYIGVAISAVMVSMAGAINIMSRTEFKKNTLDNVKKALKDMYGVVITLSIVLSALALVGKLTGADSMLAASVSISLMIVAFEYMLEKVCNIKVTKPKVKDITDMITTLIAVTAGLSVLASITSWVVSVVGIRSFVTASVSIILMMTTLGQVISMLGKTDLSKYKVEGISGTLKSLTKIFISMTAMIFILSLISSLVGPGAVLVSSISLIIAIIGMAEAVKKLSGVKISDDALNNVDSMMKTLFKMMTLIVSFIAVIALVPGSNPLNNIASAIVLLIAMRALSDTVQSIGYRNTSKDSGDAVSKMLKSMIPVIATLGITIGGMALLSSFVSFDPIKLITMSIAFIIALKGFASAMEPISRAKFDAKSSSRIMSTLNGILPIIVGVGAFIAILSLLSSTINIDPIGLLSMTVATILALNGLSLALVVISKSKLDSSTAQNISEMIKGITPIIIGLTVSLGLMAALNQFAGTSPETLVSTAISMCIALIGLGAAIRIMSKARLSKKNIDNFIDITIAMGVAMFALGAVASVITAGLQLSGVNPVSMIPVAIAMAAIIIALAAAIKIIDDVTIPDTTLSNLGTMLSIVGMAIAAIAVLTILPSGNGLITKAVALSAIMLAISACMLIIGKLTISMSGLSLGAFIPLAIILAAALAAVAVLSIMPDSKGIITKAIAMGLVMLEIAGLLAIMSIVAPLCVVIQSLAVPIIAAVAIILVILVAVAVVGKYAGELLSTGLEAVGVALGKLIGGFIGGIVAGFADAGEDTVRKYGKLMVDLMKDVGDVSESVNKIPDNFADKVQNVITALGLFTADGFLTGLVDAFSGGTFTGITFIGQTDKMHQLNLLIDAIKKLGENYDETAFNNADLAIQTVSKFVDLQNGINSRTGGLMQGILGSKSLKQIAKGISSLAVSLQYAVSIMGDMDATDFAKINMMSYSVKKFVELQNEIEDKTSGLAQLGTGSKHLSHIGTGIESLARSMKTALTSISDFDFGKETSDFSKIDAMADTAGKFITLQNDINDKTSGLAQLGTGSKHLSHIGEGISALARSMRTAMVFLSHEGVGDAVDLTKIQRISTVARSFVTLQNDIQANTGGLTQLWTGSTSLTKLGSGIANLANSLSLADGDLSGFDGKGINVERLDSITEVVGKFIDLQKRLNAEGGVVGGIKSIWGGSNSLGGNFSSGIKKIAKAMRTFDTELKDIDKGRIETGTECIDSFIECINNMPEIGGVKGWWNGDQSFAGLGKGLGALGTEIKKFSTELSGVDNLEDIKSIVESVASFAEGVAKLNDAEDGMSALKDLSDSCVGLSEEGFQNLGSSLTTFMESVDGVDFDKCTTAAQGLGQIINALNGLVGNTVDSNGVNSTTSSVSGMVDTVMSMMGGGTSTDYNLGDGNMSGVIDAAKTWIGDGSQLSSLVKSGSFNIDVSNFGGIKDVLASMISQSSDQEGLISQLKGMLSGSQFSELIGSVTEYGDLESTLTTLLSSGETDIDLSSYGIDITQLSTLISTSENKNSMLQQLSQVLNETDYQEVQSAVENQEQVNETLSNVDGDSTTEGLNNAVGNNGSVLDPQFSEKMENIAKAITTFSDNLGDIKVEEVGTAAESFAAISTGLAQMQPVDLSNTDALNDMGPALETFINSVSGCDFSNATLIHSGVTELAAMLSEIPEINSENVTSFVDAIGGLGTFNMSEFIAEWSGASQTATTCIGQFISTVVSSFGEDTFDAALNGISGFGQSIVTNLCSSINSSSETVTATATSLMTTFANGLKPGSGSVDLQQTLTTVIKQAITSAKTLTASSYTSAGKELMSKFANGIKNGGSTAKSNATSAANAAASALKVSGAYDAGKYLMQGFANGILDHKYLATQAASSAAQAAVNAIKNTAKIASPSKVTYEFGKYIDMGLANGINDYASLVSNQGTNLVLSMTSVIEDALSTVAYTIQNVDDYEPSIKPVIDTSNARSGIGELTGMLNSAQLSKYSTILSNNQVTMNNDNTELLALGTSILSAIRDGKDIYLDGNKLVGYTNRQLGKLRR